MAQIVCLNGRFVPYEEALVSVEDRGFVFADGIYEVIKFYGGRPFHMEAHMERLAKSAAEIRLPLPVATDELARACEEAVDRNGLAGRNAAVYLQVTRGPAPRAHAFPAAPHPTWFILARPENGPDRKNREHGVRAITVEDRRWHLCHVKSIGLLLNTLAKQQAMEAGAYEGLFIRDGILTEGTASNAFVVRDGRLWTHPEGPHILSGVTRQVLMELASGAGIPVEIAGVPLADLYEADEVFVSGTLSEVTPIVEIDGRPVGDGRPGPITRRLQEAFAAATGAVARA